MCVCVCVWGGGGYVCALPMSYHNSLVLPLAFFVCFNVLSVYNIYALHFRLRDKNIFDPFQGD